MAEPVRDKDGLEVCWKGTFSRHGVTIVTLAILGAAAGAGIGYAISVHTGMSRGWCMGVGGFVGFAIVGGVTYAVFDSIDQAELAAEKYADAQMKKAGYTPKEGNIDEQAKQLSSVVVEVVSKFLEDKDKDIVAA